MNENINLVEILKDCPKGTKLYSPLFGEVTLIGVYTDVDYPIKVFIDDVATARFTDDGKYLKHKKSKCVLFPSEENKDWGKFKAPMKHKQFKPFEKVLVVENEIDRKVWTADYYSHWSNSLGVYISTSGGHYESKDIIPYEGNEELLGKEVEKQ